MKRKDLKTALYAIVVMLVPVSMFAQNKDRPDRWVSAWSTAVHAPLPYGNSSAKVFENQTIRMVVRPTITGQRIRIRLSNAFGTSPLEIGAVHVALVRDKEKIVPGSDRKLTFGGEDSIAIPPGAPALSDPVELKVPVFAELAISIFLPKKTSVLTFHLLSQHESYLSGPGDYSGREELGEETVLPSWYWLADVEMAATDTTAAVVTLGDSITDGFGAKQGEYADWPDQLAKRLAEVKGPHRLAVDNEGIGGNRILYDGAGVSALARFDRDVLSKPGVTDLIVLEGINDIGWPHMKPRTRKDGTTPSKGPFADQLVTAQQIIQGLKQIIERAHEHKIRVFGATMTPYEGSNAYTEDGEEVREAVNQWIRNGRAYDGVVDFDAAVRDPNHPNRFREDYQSGDHLHPNAVGYRAMAAAIDLGQLLKAGH